MVKPTIEATSLSCEMAFGSSMQVWSTQTVRQASVRCFPAFGYALGSLGANAIVFPIGAFLLYYLTDVIGLQASLATLIISLPKLWDMLIDPALGALSDRYARKHGSRFRVFGAVAILLPLMGGLTFVVPASSHLTFSFAIVLTLIATSSLMTIFQVSHIAASDDMVRSGAAERTVLLSIRVIAQGGGAFLVGGLAPLLLGLSGSLIYGYRIMAVSIALAGGVCLLMCALVFRRIPTPGLEAGSGRLPSFMSAVRGAASNPEALGIIVSNIFVTFSASYQSSVLPYINKYELRAPDTSLSTLFAIPIGCMLLGAGLAPLLVHRFGNRKSFVLASLELITSSATYYFACHSHLALTVALAFWSFGIGAYAVTMQSSILDAAAKTTTAAGLVGLLFGLLLATNKIADASGSIFTGATLVRSSTALSLTFGLIPCLAVVLGTISLLVTTRISQRPQGRGPDQIEMT